MADISRHTRESAYGYGYITTYSYIVHNTTRRVAPCLLRQAAVASAIRKAYFGAETWWPGRTKPSKNPALSTSNKVGRHLNDLLKVVLAAARAVLPVYRTTPIAVLHRESGLLPPEIELDQLAILATVRIRRLDPYHPLYRRLLRSYA
jgi:hypothetical protein